MKKWEYEKLSIDKLYMIDEKGTEGWGLVGRINDKVYLKRPAKNRLFAKIGKRLFHLRFFLRMKFDSKFRKDINEISKRFEVNL